MTTDLNLWFLATYITIFFVLSFRARQFQWLWGSILLWLGFGLIGSRLLPGIWGITHISTLYMPQLYIVLASVFFFMYEWRKLPQKGWYKNRSCNVLLSLFAVSGVLMHLAYVSLLILIWMMFPGGVTPYVFPAVLELYIFNPINWMMAQFLIIILFYLHRTRVCHQPANQFSFTQLQGGVLLALCFQVAFVIASLVRFGI